MSDDLPLRTPSYRPPRQPGMDPATRRLALIAAGLGAALLVVIGAWSVTSGPSREGVPVIAPPAGPLRQPPPAAAGVHVAGANQPIFNQGAPPAGGSAVMPGPETPDLAALHAPPPASPSAAAPAAPSPAAAPVTAPVTTPVATPASAPPGPAPAPALPTPPAFRSAPAPAAAPAPIAASHGRAGGTTIQLAALPTHAAALSEWQVLRRRYPTLLGRHRPVISRARVNGHIWFRVRTGHFASRSAAARLCARLRAAGAACDVTRP